MELTTPQQFIQTISQMYDREQPWLTVDHGNAGRGGGANLNGRSYKWSGSMLKRGRAKNRIQVPGISAISFTCERKIVSDLYGVVGWKKAPEDIQHTSKGATLVNDELDRIFTADPFGDITPGNTEEEYRDKRSGQWKTGRVGSFSLYLPRDTNFTMIDGTPRRWFTGILDYVTENEIIELKSVKPGDAMPEHIDSVYYRQVVAYLIGNPGKTGAWVIYVPTDLSTAKHNDPNSYRAFWISRAEASKYWGTVMLPQIKELTWKMSWLDGTPEMFYRLINSLPECEGEWCCKKAREFREKVTINADWTFTEK